MHCVDHVSEVLEFLMGLYTWVVDVRCSAEVVNLCLAVEFGDGAALLSRKGQQFGLLLGGKSLEVSNSALHLFLEKREKGVVLVLHKARGDTSEGRLEGILLDLSLGCGVTNGGLNLFEGAYGDLSEVIAEVLLLIVLDHLQHVADSAVEVLLHVQLLVGEVVDQSSLLNVVVLAVDANVLHLLLCVSEVSKLLLLGDVGPLAA